MSIFPPIDITGADIVEFPGDFKLPVDEARFLVEVPPATCRHFNGPFEVDVKGSKCKCKKCGAEVAAMFVLEQLMHMESQWMRTRAAYQDEMKRLDERSRTKCQKCGEITRISK